jgi:signal peptidase
MNKSKRYIPPQFLNEQGDSLNQVVYTGPSMNPTLRAPDILSVVPYNERKIRCGDVIVFVPPGGNHRITHRVISVDKEGIKTRGDNNSNIDTFILKPDNIIGRVTYARRGNKLLRIYAGLPGQLYVIAVKTVRKIDMGISFLLHPIYHWLSKIGVFRWFVPLRLKPRIISFKRPPGVEHHLVMGRRIVGKRLPGKEKWYIKRPFRLFVDEKSLFRESYNSNTPASKKHTLDK